jgi:hypothetical protein
MSLRRSSVSSAAHNSGSPLYDNEPNSSFYTMLPLWIRGGRPIVCPLLGGHMIKLTV